MFGRMRNLVIAAFLSMSAVTPAFATSWYTAHDWLAGANTVDTWVEFEVPDHATISFTVSGEGDGHNELEFRVQQKTSTGNWVEIETKVLNMPSDSASGSAYVGSSYRSGNEKMRLRLSRKAFTDAIYWSVKFGY